MADQGGRTSTGTGANAGFSRPPKPPNPVWRMMGLPNFRLKLPSRNWLIFLTLTGSWSAAVYYDRREKKRIQKKWSTLVEHIAQEPTDTHQLPRRLSVFLSAPPADGLVPARDHFNEYIKPILVAAALDWDAVEGRREGDVRAGLAERIRRLRKKRGEATAEPLAGGVEDVLEESRRRSGVEEWQGVAGDIVIGRHAWKEYVRGLHEGWLGPLDPPAEAEKVVEPPAALSLMAGSTDPSPTQPPLDDASPAAATQATPELEKPQGKEKKTEESKPKKKAQPPPFNAPADYNVSHLSPNCPSELAPCSVVPLPHLLGFFKFPVRIYRFLNRRQVADEVGRQTAAAVLAAYRPYDAPGEATLSSDEDRALEWEQQRLLIHEEAEWHKSVRDRKDGDQTERVWLDDMVLDARIAERMRKFELDVEAEEQAKRILNEPGKSWWTSWPETEKKKGAWEGLSDELD